jgi:preprotein translocase subunit SecD
MELLKLNGYSMNDTIVVFDRIRENRRAHGREPLALLSVASHIGRRSAIVLDEEILGMPVNEEVIRDLVRIRSARTREGVNDLAVNLRSGALPAAFEVAITYDGDSNSGFGAQRSKIWEVSVA